MRKYVQVKPCLSEYNSFGLVAQFARKKVKRSKRTGSAYAAHSTRQIPRYKRGKICLQCILNDFLHEKVGQ